MSELALTTLLADGSLEGYYKGESGALTTDSSSKGRTLTNNGTVASSSGVFGGAFDFGASNTTKYMSITNNMGIDGGNISLSIWAKLTTSPGDYSLIAQQSDNTDVLNYITLNSTSVLFHRLKQNVADQSASYTFTLPSTTYTHIVMTYDGTNIRGYVNSSLVAGPTAASGSGSGTNANGFSIGSNVLGQTKFSGLIDDAAIFSRVLTQEEISKLYDLGVGGMAMLFGGGVTIG